MNTLTNTTALAVIGAGHAGVEAALAAARMGVQTVLFTMNLDAVANMPCNPSIGGTGKGHLVFEVDALGGEMGVAADKVTLQSRTLNLGKGPAVHSKRVQADRYLYRQIIKQTLEDTPNLCLVQAEIVDIKTEPAGNGKKRVTEIITALGTVWKVQAVVIAVGTFLDSHIVVGEKFIPSGPDGMLPSKGLTTSLMREGVSFMRFKTGTPPRVHADTIDFSQLERQDGEEFITPFSALTDEEELNKINQIPCHIAYTNEKTHEIIKNNLHRSPMYSGAIKGTGARYCPSIEDKVVRFADKERHQLFVEPVGKNTKEMYIQGLSTSMPEDVQVEILHSIKGFENAQIMRNAYAIEYNCVDPLQLYPTLEFKEIEGLYGAGQFNGTSGYEEAAAQGIVAGINAALKIKGEEPLILTRDSSYIGMLIDDLVTKGTNEPYRVMTSRTEYRLLLRQDNAAERLSKYGHRVGLISDERMERVNREIQMVKEEIERAEKTTIKPCEELNAMLLACDTSPLAYATFLADLIRRPRVTYEMLAPFDTTRPELPRSVRQKVEIEIKYEGYIKRQLSEVERFSKLESKKIPPDINYHEIKGLRLEARQKLDKIRPENLGQASRISGVSPADISVLLITLSMRERQDKDDD